MSNEMDDTELWLLDPNTTLDDINNIANGDDSEAENPNLRP